MDTKNLKKQTLFISRDNFEYILTGEQKTEHREILPSVEKRYLYTEGEGENMKVYPVKYDVLYLINGRRKDSPRMVVEIESADIVAFMNDKTKEPLMVQYGEDLIEDWQIWYHLGKVIETENVPEDFEFKYAGKVPYDYGMDDSPFNNENGGINLIYINFDDEEEG